jgi:hypothetical protein
MRAANSIYSAIHALPAEAAAVCAPLVPSRLAAYQPSLAPDADRTRAQALAEWSKLVARGRAGWREVALEATYWTVRPRHPPDYLVDSTPLFECGRRWGEPVAVPGCFQPVARFTPGMSPCSTQFDKFDAFFLPFDRFEGIERMGPEVTIYANRCLATGVSR